MFKKIVLRISICIVVLFLACLLWRGYLEVYYNGKSAALNKLTARGRGVVYACDWEIDEQGRFTEELNPPDYSFWEWMQGRDYTSARVRAVFFPSDYPPVKIDASLRILLKEFPELCVLEVLPSCISDNDLKTISGFSDLIVLSLNGTSITDEGVEHLLLLKNLQHLDVRGTQITQHGIERLYLVFPNCIILESTRDNEVSVPEGE